MGYGLCKPRPGYGDGAVAIDDELIALQDWYLRQADGEWEHSYGVSIDTLDNPGWRVRIDLQGTALAGRPFKRTETHRTESDWVVCWVESDQFHAACGPQNLLESLKAFRTWAG